MRTAFNICFFCSAIVGIWLSSSLPEDPGPPPTIKPPMMRVGPEVFQYFLDHPRCYVFLPPLISVATKDHVPIMRDCSELKNIPTTVDGGGRATLSGGWRNE